MSRGPGSIPFPHAARATFIATRATVNAILAVHNPSNWKKVIISTLLQDTRCQRHFPVRAFRERRMPFWKSTSSMATKTTPCLENPKG